MRYDADGKPYEPEWVAADVIVGNPPFIGDKKMLRQLGVEYVTALRGLYEPRVAGGANFVTYWFEKARSSISANASKRAGLLGTTSIRKGKSNLVLRAIKNSGDIFLGWSDHEWVLDGAQVRVAIVGFDDGTEISRTLDGNAVARINADLTAEIDLTTAQQLPENLGLACVGDQKGGAFDIPENEAHDLLALNNPNGLSNSDVVRMYFVSHDIANRWSRRWIIDFYDLPYEQAARYKAPMSIVEQRVKPSRLENADKASRERWWLHQRPRPELRAETQNLKRFIATPRVAKHRLFVWLDSNVIPDSRILAIFRDDDYFFGVLHSSAHEIWALRTASRHGVGDDPTYNQKECFEAYPFIFPPGQEDAESSHYQAISATAKQLNDERELWLNPPDLVALGASEKLLKERTLTNLYNALVAYREGKLAPTRANPAIDFAPRLAALHDALDRAVLAAYGWNDLPDVLRTPEGDEELLRRLLALNLERAGKLPETEQDC